MIKEQWIAAKEKILTMSVDEFIEILRKNGLSKPFADVNLAVDVCADIMESEAEASAIDAAYERSRDN